MCATATVAAWLPQSWLLTHPQSRHLRRIQAVANPVVQSVSLG